MDKNVAVAISGGVDSLYAALKLKESGYNVTGFHFVSGYEKKFILSDNFPGKRMNGDVKFHPVNGTESCVDESMISAMNALSHDLQIPMHIIDCKDYFKKNVIDYFTDAYNRGLTPNPCLVCNQRIKFGFLKDFIKTMGIKKMATGHYARTKYDLNGIVHLHINPDTIKDQSYFLAFLTQEQLSDVIFPLSDVTKAEVTAFIRKSGLRPITQPESQDICFIQSGSYKDFISGQADFSSRKGPVVLSDGQVIGHHNGLHGFTIGQRKGINCPGPYPYYVIEINTRSNTLLVGPKEQLLKKRCTVSSIQWISKPPDRHDSIITKIRYAHKGAESKLIIDENKNATIFFDTPQYAITPGQGAVFYRDGEVLGGGIINSA